MSSTSFVGELSGRVRALAFVIAAVLLAAVGMAVSEQGSAPTRASHFLGLRQLRLDAASGQARIYLRIPPITPTPAGSGHSKDVKITSFSWGVSNSASVGSVSTGGSGGKVSFNPFSIVKQVDRSSPLFFHLAASGQHAQSATLYVLPPGGKSSADEMLEFQLGQPRVSSAVDASTPHGSNETIGLVYSTLTETYLQKGKVEATNVYQISG